jgi:hypothetical protein
MLLFIYLFIGFMRKLPVAFGIIFPDKAYDVRAAQILYMRIVIA